MRGFRGNKIRKVIITVNVFSQECEIYQRQEYRNTTVIFTILCMCGMCRSLSRGGPVNAPGGTRIFRNSHFPLHCGVGRRASLAPGLSCVQINNECVRACVRAFVRACVHETACMRARNGVCVHVPPKLSSTLRASDAFVSRLRGARAQPRTHTRRSVYASSGETCNTCIRVTSDIRTRARTLADEVIARHPGKLCLHYFHRGHADARRHAAFSERTPARRGSDELSREWADVIRKLRTRVGIIDYAVIVYLGISAIIAYLPISSLVTFNVVERERIK